MNENKKIVKNSAFMYFRMIISMIVSLYTSRIVLEELGIADYGVYNVIAGIVIIFSFINNAMASSTSRYISYAIGLGNKSEIQIIFGNTLTMHIALSLFVLIMAETIGLWYIQNVMKLPDLGSTIQIVYQCSIVNVVIIIINVPLSSLIISYERMNIYAYMTIFDVFAKLGIAYSLKYVPIIKLEMYAFLQTLISISIVIIYYIYCRRNNFIESVNLKCNTIYLKSMFKFSSWTLYSNASSIALAQGTNLLLNFFWGVTINAAYGISTQIQRAATTLSFNFQIAINPQLVKSFSSRNYNRHYMLVECSAKLSSFLIMLTIFPIYFNLSDILNLWLTNYPTEAIGFSKWILFMTVIITLANPFGVSVEASGKIGRMTFLYSTIAFLLIPVSYLIILNFKKADLGFMILVINATITLIIKIYYYSKVNGINISSIAQNVLLPVVLILILSFFSCSLAKLFLSISFLWLIIIDILIVGSLIWIIGLKKSEKAFLINTIKSNISK